MEKENNANAQYEPKQCAMMRQTSLWLLKTMNTDVQYLSYCPCPWLTNTGPSSLELTHCCLKLVFTVKVIMFCQLIPLRPTCPIIIIIIICLNEITQWLSSFHWSHKAAWFGNISRRGRVGTYSRWGTMCCRVGIILLGPNDLMLTLDGSGSQWCGFN